MSIRQALSILLLPASLTLSIRVPLSEPQQIDRLITTTRFRTMCETESGHRNRMWDQFKVSILKRTLSLSFSSWNPLKLFWIRGMTLTLNAELFRPFVVFFEEFLRRVMAILSLSLNANQNHSKFKRIVSWPRRVKLILRSKILTKSIIMILSTQHCWCDRYNHQVTLVRSVR